MTSDTTLSRAKAATWSWSELAQFDDSERICIELTERQIVALLAVATNQLKWSTRWSDYTIFSDVSQFATRLADNLMASDECKPGQPPAKIIEQICTIIERIEVRMPSLTIEYIGNVPYLRQDCGCGQPRYFLLSETVVAENGLPQPASDAGNASASQYPANQSDTNCYARKATDYLLTRAQQYIEWSTSLQAKALDIAFSDFDEAVDTGALASNIIDENSVIEEIRSIGVDTVNAAIARSRDVLESAWSYNSEVNRFQLAKWLNNAPILDGIVPVRLILQQWLLNSVIPFYNRDLSMLANECNTANNVLPPVAPIAKLGTFTNSSKNYVVEEVFSVPLTISGSNSVYANFGTFENIVGAVWSASRTGSCASGIQKGLAVIDSNNDVLQEYSNYSNQPTGWSRSGPSGIISSATSLVPGWPGSGGNYTIPVNPESGRLVAFGCGGGATWTYNEMYVIRQV